MPTAATAAQLNSIPEFRGDGTDANSIEDYMKMIDRMITQYDWGDNHAAAAVKSRLRGPAAEWLCAEELELKEYAAFGGDSGLKQALLDAFKSEVPALEAAKAIADLKQKHGESVTNFKSRVTKAIDKKNHRLTADEKKEAGYQTQLKQDQYTFVLAGLLPEYHEAIMKAPSPPQDIAALIKAVKQMEPKNLVAKPAAQEFLAAVAVKDDSKTLEVEVAELKQQLQKMSFPGRGNSTIKCFKCQGLGHIAAKCPSSSYWANGRRPHARGRGGRGGRGGFNRGYRRGRNGSRGDGRFNQFYIPDAANDDFEFAYENDDHSNGMNALNFNGEQ